MDVAVVGGSGYAGGELLRLLSTHPSYKVTAVAGARSAGRDLHEVFGHLGLEGRIVPAEPQALADAELVFLATPHGPSLDLALPLVAAGVTVIDLSAAFRLTPAAFARAYGEPHPVPWLAPAPYGLPELFRDTLPGASLVAAPGCYPTATLLALAPLAGLVDPASVVVAGLSGTSGAGAGLRTDLHASHVMGSVAPYGAPHHRHTWEIEQGWAALAGLAEPLPVSFTPHLVPMSRGLVATVTAALTPGIGAEDVAGAYRAAYDAEPFVSVLPAGSWPSTGHVLGANSARMGVAVDARTGRVTASCAIDNLGKGAAGQAVQAANVALGLPEGAGLSAAAVYP